MTTTDTARAERLAALQARRAPTGARKGKRRRPAEASRIFVAGASTAAMLTLVAVMGRGTQDTQGQTAQAVTAPGALQAASAAPLPTPASPTTTVTSNAGTKATTVAPATTTTTVAPIQTVTITPPTRTATVNTRTNGSR